MKQIFQKRRYLLKIIDQVMLINLHEFEQALRDTEDSEACHAAVHGVRESDMT